MQMGYGRTLDSLSRDELMKMAFYEPVTQFYNWYWMRDKLSHIEDYGIKDYAFVHFDIKDFNMVNIIYGHDVADNLLRRVCSVMSELDWSYAACRCDNDNFAMMIHKMPEEEISFRLMEMFDELSVLPEDPKYPVYFRCGVVSIDTITDYKVTVTDLAKLAQKLGKKANSTEIHFYTEAMQEKMLRSKLLKNDLQRAFAENELLVYFQPKYNPKDNSLIGAEALVRWNYHHEQILGPGAFVPYLEQEGVIGQIDQFVLEEVCRNLSLWKSQGRRLVPISVNMSRIRLYNPTLVQIIVDTIKKYDVETSLIEFELTESAAYEDSTYMIKVMESLRDMGFKISIDDFGTGYSSLNLLSKMPLTTLKIDKSFVDGIEKGDEESSRLQYMVKSIIGMTKQMNITSIAEGVETEGQLELLKSWQCDYIQGYYYSTPLPEAEFEKLI